MPSQRRSRATFLAIAIEHALHSAVSVFTSGGGLIVAPVVLTCVASQASMTTDAPALLALPPFTPAVQLLAPAAPVAPFAPFGVPVPPTPRAPPLPPAPA